MWNNLLFVSLGLILVLTIIVVMQRLRSAWERDRDVRDLLATSTGSTGKPVRMKQTEHLPRPVREYLNHAIRDGQVHVETVRMTQRGTFREANPASPWNPFQATQHVTTAPPGFVWDASIQIVPWVPVDVVDRYVQGRGALRARLAGVITVQKGEPGPMLDEGELVRYLAEAPLYPTALLPNRGVDWAPIDERSARATLVDGSTTASLVFTFNENNEVVRVSGRRPFTNADGSSEYRSWTGYWDDYVTHDGMRVPTRGEVAWVHPEDGEVRYWRGEIVSIEYNVRPPGSPATVKASRSVPETALGLAQAS